MSDFWNDKVQLAEFWGDSEYFTGPPLTDEMIQKAEKRYGYKFPETLLRLLRIRNGGSPRRCYFRIEGLRGWSGGYFVVDSLRGVGDHFWRIETAEYYPKIGLVVAGTPSGGHDYVMLDYSKCGKKGEPRVVHAVQGCRARDVTVLAPTFADFIVALSADCPDDDENQSP